MNKWKHYAFWRWLRDWCVRRMEHAWMMGGNCDSACPRCKQWESHGNRITTQALEDGTERRKCQSCGNQWRTVFTPCGFMPIEAEEL